MKMRTEATAAEVTKAVRLHMSVQPAAVEVDWTLFFKLAEALLIDVRAGTLRDQRRTEDRLRGQIRAALNKLSADGTLVKDRSGHRTRFMTPQVAERHKLQAAENQARELAQRERKASLVHRIKALGVTETDFGDQAGKFIINLDTAEFLIGKAESAGSAATENQEGGE